MSQKQSTSACTRIRIHSEIGKENKLPFRKSYNLLKGMIQKLMEFQTIM